MASVAFKQDLVSALGSYVGQRQKRKARRFLLGLAADELQYIAEFLGACILESDSLCPCSRRQLAEGIEHFESCREHNWATGLPDCQAAAVLENQEHKMILLLEYLCHCGLAKSSVTARAGKA